MIKGGAISVVFSLLYYGEPLVGGCRVGAATYSVTNTQDGGPGSLREAVTRLNENLGGVVDLTGISGELLITNALPKIVASGEIRGPGPDLLKLNGGYQTRLLSIATGVTQHISGLQFSGSRPGYNESGGAILNAGSLSLTNCRFAANYCSGGFGGAIFTSGELVIKQCQFWTNVADGGAGFADFNVVNTPYTVSGGSGAGMGGAIFVDSGECAIFSSTFVANQVYGGNGTYFNCNPFNNLEGALCHSSGGGGPQGGTIERPYGGFGSGGAVNGDGGFGGGGGGNGGHGGYGGGDGAHGWFDGLHRGDGEGGGGGGFGGAIFTKSGLCTIDQSLFLNNFAIGGAALMPGAALGGAIFVMDGDFSLNRSITSSNQVTGQTITLLNDPTGYSLYATAPGCGGAIHIHGGTAKIDSCSIISNLVISPPVSLQSTPFGNGHSTGSALSVDGGHTTVLNSTFSGNLIQGSWGYLQVLNTSLRGGAADGGAISITNGWIKIESSTIVSNLCKAGDAIPVYCLGEWCRSYSNASGSAGIYVGGGDLQLKNSLLAGNGGYGGVLHIDANNLNPVVTPSSFVPQDGFGPIESLGFNLIQTTNDIRGIIQTDLTGVMPNLRPLSVNAAGTYSHELSPGSYGVNSIPPGLSVNTDQRGIARPQGPASDIGAVETEGDSTQFGPIATLASLTLSADYGTLIEIPAAMWTSFPTVQFQWFKDGQPISGATNFSLSLGLLNLASQAVYEVRATNDWGNASRKVTIDLNPHREIPRLEWVRFTAPSESKSSVPVTLRTFNGLTRLDSNDSIYCLTPPGFRFDSEPQLDPSLTQGVETIRALSPEGHLRWSTNIPAADRDNLQGSLVEGGEHSLGVISTMKQDLSQTTSFQLLQFDITGNQIAASAAVPSPGSYQERRFYSGSANGLLMETMDVDPDTQRGRTTLAGVDTQFNSRWTNALPIVNGSSCLAFTNQVLVVGDPSIYLPPPNGFDGNVKHQIWLIDDKGTTRWSKNVASSESNFAAIGCAGSTESAYLLITTQARKLLLGKEDISTGANYQNGLLLLIRIDSNGNLVWSRKIAGVVQSGLPSIKADSKGFVYLAFQSQESIFLEGGGLGSFLAKVTNVQESFGLCFAKYNSEGEVLWAVQRPTPNNIQVIDLASDGDGGMCFYGALQMGINTGPEFQFGENLLQSSNPYLFVGRWATRPRISILDPQPGLQARFGTLYGEPDRTYELEVSEDLIQWDASVKLVAKKGVVEFPLIPQVQTGGRFFRARAVN